jgi:pimeloyl-ACP methyl ester carboxylesterase
MRARHPATRSSLAAALLLALVLPGCASTTSTQSVPRFEPTPCAYKLGQGIVDGTNVHCGFLIVREDRANPHSRTIKLAVAILKTPSATPAADPVIYLSGGPGESPLTDFAPFFTAASLPYVLGDRDLIIFDPRGTGESQPSLDCPELRDAEYGSLGTNQSSTQLIALERRALQQCHTRLTAEGLDLGLYNTVTTAADVHDLIHALGYRQVNLNGGSYGTRLGLEIMRDFSQGVRSAVLDAVLAPQLTFFTSIPPALMRSFETLFATCAANSTCNTKYPHLETLLDQTIAKLNAHPLTFQAQDPFTGRGYSVVLNGARFVSLLTLSLYQTDLLAEIPAAIAQAQQGTTTLLQRFFDEVWFGEDAISRGMWFSVECGEDAPFITSHDIAAAEQALTPPLRAADPFNMQGRYDTCQFWTLPPLPAAQKQAVTSAIPTLILEGEFDPVTPPANGALVAKTLSHSYSLVFPGIGHGVDFTGPCPTGIVLAFQANPDQQPDTSCIAQLGEPAFT